MIYVANLNFEGLLSGYEEFVAVNGETSHNSRTPTANDMLIMFHIY